MKAPEPRRWRRRYQTDERIARLEALVRAALLHRAGRRDLLLFTMRERFEPWALATLGYSTLEELIADAERRGRSNR